ncbi:hypothetical protein [Streptomyces chartreusis]|uniref:hypothetical protein n=1 Tax=Streptomyces chartreusis TaxID=1969 RepID=UPI00381450AC
MDALSPALLVKAALTAAIHTAQAPGCEVWHQLAELVARPPDTTQPPPLCAPGMRELDALTATPASEARAKALADVLTQRAGHDPQFRTALQAWENEARSRSLQDEPPLQAVASCVQGAVLQSGFLSGISFVTYGPQGRQSGT